MLVRVKDDGDFSKPIAVTIGVKQGCVLAPTLFSIMFSAMLSEAFRDVDDGITIRYRMGGKLLNLQRLLAKSKVKEATVRDLLFADDCALNASSEPEMQQIMNKFSSECDSFSLTISTKKTEVMFQPAPRNAYTEPSITVKGVTLKVMESFAYLGNILSRSVPIDNEIDARIAKASTAFGRLRKKVWERNGLTTRTKLKVYKAVVLPSLLLFLRVVLLFATYRVHQNLSHRHQNRSHQHSNNVHHWNQNVFCTNMKFSH